MTILYRILSVFINAIAALLAVSLLFSLPMLLSSPVTMLSGFMMIAIVLYSFFSYKFHRQVLQQHQPVKKSLKDYIRVNGIVAIVFSINIFISVVFLLQHPDIYVEAVSNLGVNLPLDRITAVFYVMLVYAIALLVHVLWTFALMKKNQAYFNND